MSDAVVRAFADAAAAHAAVVRERDEMTEALQRKSDPGTDLVREHRDDLAREVDSLRNRLADSEQDRETLRRATVKMSQQLDALRQDHADLLTRYATVQREVDERPGHRNDDLCTDPDPFRCRNPRHWSGGRRRD